MKRRPMTAAGLRLTLTISLFMIAALTCVAFYFITGLLDKAAEDVSHSGTEAASSQSNLSTLQKIQQELKKKQDVVQRAQSIVAESQSYQYQDQIITDLNGIAAGAGITITNIDFGGEAASGQTAAPSTGQSGTTTPNTSTPTGVKSTSVSVTIQNPVGYENLLRFINAIEQNLTKMQIARIGISKSDGGGVTSEGFTIEVYIR